MCVVCVCGACGDSKYAVLGGGGGGSTIQCTCIGEGGFDCTCTFTHLS